MRSAGRLLSRILVILAAIVVVALIAVAGLLAIVTGRALPQTSGTLTLAGLDADVTVYRDAHGIAQMVADTPHDLFAAQGYVHAQDRFWQMEFWRHISAGRLSELFGEGQLDADRLIRTLDWRGAAQRDLDAMSTEARTAMDAYAEGVNAWIEANRDRASLALVVVGLQSGAGSGLSGYPVEPWTPQDSAAWQKVQAFNLGGNYDSEIFRMLADALLGDPARTDELLPPGGPTGPVITPSELLGSGADRATGSATHSVPVTPNALDPGTDLSAWTSLADLRGRILELAGLDAGGALSSAHGVGSNNWVVAPSRSESGHALLANDPHLGLAMPSVWYMNGLRCRVVSGACPYDVVGVSFPGAPAVILGHNARIAWGATNLGPDVQDLFIETPDPDDPTRYLFRGESLPFQVRSETIRVAGADPVTIEIRATHHGPILNDADERLADDAPLLSLRWTAIAEADGTFDSIISLNRAASFDDFRSALSTYGSPSQNFVYADVDGHIGYVLPGLIPVRQAADARGDRPVDGASGEHEWTGYVPFDELPWQLDPEPGAIVTANNRAVDDAYPHFIGQEWDEGDRAQRVLDLLGELGADGVSMGDLGTMQADTYLLRADRIVPRLDEVVPATDDGRALLSAILSWDRTCGIDSLGCAAYVPFEFNVLRAIFDDELGTLAKDYVGGGESFRALERFLDDPHSPWWEDTGTPGEDVAAEVMAHAADETAAQLRAALGDPDGWTWGRLHTGTFREQTLGSSGIGPLEWYYDTGPFPVPGAAGTVNNNYYRTWRAYPDPLDPEFEPVGIDRLFTVSNGPSYRLVIDMGDLDGARIIQSTGQSGNPFDAHYGDLVDDWAGGRTIPLPFSLERVRMEAVATLTLTP